MWEGECTRRSALRRRRSSLLASCQCNQQCLALLYRDAASIAREHAHTRARARARALSLSHADTYTQVCESNEDPQHLMLCDMCDEAYHTYCLRPVLKRVPPGEWACPRLDMHTRPHAHAPSRLPASCVVLGARTPSHAWCVHTLTRRVCTCAEACTLMMGCLDVTGATLLDSQTAPKSTRHPSPAGSIALKPACIFSGRL